MRRSVNSGRLDLAAAMPPVDLERRRISAMAALTLQGGATITHSHSVIFN